MAQAELGRRVGLDPSEMWKVETGRKGMRIWRLKAIAAALSVTVDSLIADVSTAFDTADDDEPEEGAA